ncbi:MAG: Trk system potassium transporter TrkA [Melioribacteraceae bacterium]|nr:Trk system potassium transporter TrkA [Melioribacteraceae bacterium]
MKIIIAGAGEVGYHLAKQLSSEAHDISVIDIDPAHLDRTNSTTDVMTILGSSTSIRILEKAKVEKTDLVVAVTSSESVNINTAIIAKKLGAQKTIARVSSAEYVSEDYRQMFKSIGIDHLIYPEELAAFEVVKLIERAAATDVLEFEDGRLSLIGIKLDKSVPVLRMSMKEASEKFGSTEFRIVAIHRGMKTIIPSGEDIFLPNDQVFVITTHEGVDEMIKLSGKEDTKLQNIMILGGGKIGRKTAKLLENVVNIKLIESDSDKTADLADYLQRTLVIHGDGRDIDLLAQEGIIDMDAFIAVTNDAETNIITCLMAKHLGVSKTIAQVDNVDYIPLTQTIGLDSLINQKLITANNITRFIRKADIVSLATLQGIDAEVLEYVVKPKSQILKGPVSTLKFPGNSILGGYVRDNTGHIVKGDTVFKVDDKVVVFTLPDAISKVEKFFS